MSRDHRSSCSAGSSLKPLSLSKIEDGLPAACERECEMAGDAGLCRRAEGRSIHGCDG